MKKLKLFFGLLAVFGVAAYWYYAHAYIPKEDALFIQNVEALAGLDGNCNYENGYRAFSSRGGGGYDCSRVWRENRPVNS